MFQRKCAGLLNIGTIFVIRFIRSVRFTLREHYTESRILYIPYDVRRYLVRRYSREKMDVEVSVGICSVVMIKCIR